MEFFSLNSLSWNVPQMLMLMQYPPLWDVFFHCPVIIEDVAYRAIFLV